MQLLGLRQFLETLFQDILGTYTFPGGATKPAISVDGPAEGVRVTGLEVIIASTPRVKVAKMAYTAGHSAVLQSFQLHLYQWSGSNLSLAQYRIAQVWPDASLNLGQAIARHSRVPSLQVGINVLGPIGIVGGNAFTLPGGTSFLFNQVEPAILWTINHDLGFYPTVETYDSELNSIEGLVTHPTVNQTRITFTEPVAGFARLS